MGRPKKSRDVECKCEWCGKEYAVPEWQNSGRRFCSLICSYASRKGNPLWASRIEPQEKTCPQCEKVFLVGGGGRPRYRQVYCSQACSAKALGYQPEPRVLTDIEVAWLAGLFDGEGSIVFSRKGKLSSVRAAITNTHYPLLERVLEITGTGAIIEQTRHRTNPKHSRSWHWTCQTSNARNLLRQMLPYLIVKKEKAELALSIE